MPGDDERIITVPNLLSALRIASVAVFLGLLLEHADVAALVVVAAAACTDFFDGYLARRLHQVTRLGALLDPIADKLTILAAAVGLSVRGLVPWWFVLIVFGREAVMLVLGAVLVAHDLSPLPSSRLGKIGTFLLLAALPVFVYASAVPSARALLLPAGLALGLIGAAVYWASALGYARTTASWLRDRRDDPPGASVSLGDRRRSPYGR